MARSPYPVEAWLRAPVLAAISLALGAASAPGQSLAIGDLPAGASITIEFDVTVGSPVPAGLNQVCNQGSVAGDNVATVPTDDPAAGGPADPTCTPLVAQPDLALTKSDGGASVAPGGTVAYTLGYSNIGNQGATGVVLTDTVPASTTFNAGASTAGWVCVPNGNPGSICTLPVGALAGGGANGSATFAVTVVNPVPAGLNQISNTASVADDGTNGADPNPGNNSASDTTPVDAAPDLTLTKDDGGAAVVPGGTVAYTLGYANAGNQGAAGVVLTETVPASTTFNAGASTAGWVCVPNGNPGSTCTLAVGALAGGGANGNATFAVTVVNPVPAGLNQLSNTASVADDGTNGADPSPGNNSASDTTPVDAAPDLTIAKSDGGATVVPGGTVAYTLTYSNAGNQGATGVVLTETVPANTTFNAGASTPGWVCVPNGNAGSTCTLPVGALAGGGAGTAATFAVTVVDPVPAGVAQISNTASVADDGANGADPNPGNNSALDTTPLDAAPDLTIAKSYDGPTPFPGDTIDFDLAYSNAGNQGATGVVLTETVPANTTFNAGASTPGWVCVPNGNADATCTFAVGALAGGGTGAAAVFAVDLDSPLPPGTTETENCASIADDAANGADPNPGDNSDCFTVVLDAIPPEVDSLDSIAGTGDGSLDECETALAPVSSLVATFSEAMANPPGDGGANDVTNPANYLLVAPGPDLAFDTTSCPSPAGDDVAFPASSVAYDGGSFVATVAYGTLADGPYRLLVCPTLTDLAGNPLDGDGDGTGGDPFVRTFRVDRHNRLANGHFDCDLAAWTVSAATAGEVFWSADDRDGAAESGSVGVTNLLPGIDTTFAISQCSRPLTSGTLELRARARLTAAPGVLVNLTRRCDYFSGTGCVGSLGNSSATLLVGDSAGAWLALDGVVTPPAGSASARCTLRLTTTSGASFDARLDQLFLGVADEIFSDDFESGDRSHWSTCAGCL